ncbi:MAG: DNA polymerase III subunit delta [Eubacteriales bacterium]|nr:DNA polymerase III subunit delta [Eubacteriales bacterium]
MKNLLQDLKTNEFKNIYLLFGEEDYLKKQYKKKLQDALISQDDTVNLNSYEGKNISVKELIDQAETMPFFAERRLLLIEDSGFFKNASPELAEYLEHLPDTACFMFVETDVDKRGKLYKTVKSKGRVMEFSSQNEDTLTRWILGILKKENKNITRSAMQLFLEKTGTDMNRISTELEKLLSYTADREVVTPEDIEAICTTQTVNKIFDMINAIADGNQKRAYDLYYDLLALKEPPMRILFLLARQFNQLFHVKQMRALGYDVQAIASKLGMQGFVARNCLRQSGSFEMERLKYLIDQCVEAEEAVKTGNLNEKLAVELILSEAGRKPAQ